MYHSLSQAAIYKLFLFAVFEVPFHISTRCKSV